MEQLTETRAGVVDAADAERRRLERDLHDGTQQRLVSLAINLGMARAQAGTAEEAKPGDRRGARGGQGRPRRAARPDPRPAPGGARGPGPGRGPVRGRRPDADSGPADRGPAAPPGAGDRGGRLLRGVRGAREHRQALPGHRGRGVASSGPPTGCTSSSPTTAWAAPTRPGAPAWPAWPGAPRPSTGPSKSTARPAGRPSSPWTCHATANRPRPPAGDTRPLDLDTQRHAHHRHDRRLRRLGHRPGQQPARRPAAGHGRSDADRHRDAAGHRAERAELRCADQGHHRSRRPGQDRRVDNVRPRRRRPAGRDGHRLARPAHARGAGVRRTTTAASPSP